MQLTPKQREYWLHANHRWNVKCGATRSGKTWLDYYLLPRRVRACRGRAGLVVLMGNTVGPLQRNVIEPMQSIYGPALVSSIRVDSTAMMFGQRVHCLGADNQKHVDRLRGASIQYCYGDEVATWNADVFNMLKSRLDREYSLFDGTCNPEGPRHWLKRFLDSDADIFQQSYALSDNPFLPASVRESIEREYAGTVWYRRYVLGLWTQAEGAVYDMWSDENLFDEAEWERLDTSGMRRYVACDYGTANPMVFLDAWDDGTTLRIANEYYYDSRARHRQKTDEQYADDFEKFVNKDRAVTVILDPSANSFRLSLRNRGYRVKSADNAVLDGIRVTSAMIRRRRLLARRDRVPNLLRELDGYVWDESAARMGEERPVKMNDHAMDAMRYLVKTVVNRRRMACQ